jgi:hypothetical protein
VKGNRVVRRGVGQSNLVGRITGVLRLDPATFEEIEHDESATTPALVIALLVGVSMGIRTGLLETLAGSGLVLRFSIIVDTVV